MTDDADVHLCLFFRLRKGGGAEMTAVPSSGYDVYVFLLSKTLSHRRQQRLLERSACVVFADI